MKKMNLWIIIMKIKLKLRNKIKYLKNGYL